MAKTPNFLPYPVGTDKVVDGDNAMAALAGALRMCHGATSVGPPTGGASIADKAVTFPAGLFTVAPHIFCSAQPLSTGSSVIAGVSTAVTPTKDGFTIRIVTNTGATFSNAYTVSWFAIQLPTS